MPSSRARSTSGARSASVPRSGWMAVWPPSGAADGPRAADVVGAGRERVVLALAVRWCRWGGSAGGRPRRSPCRPRPAADRASRRSRPRSGGRTRTRRRDGPARGRPTAAADRWSVRSAVDGDAGESGTRASSRAALRRTSSLQFWRRMAVTASATRCWAPPATSGSERLEEQGALLELGGDVFPGADLEPEVLAPGGEPVGPGLDHELVRARRRRRASSAAQLSLPVSTSGAVYHFSRPGPPAHPGGEQVVAVAEDAGPTPGWARRPRSWGRRRRPGWTAGPCR